VIKQHPTKLNPPRWADSLLRLFMRERDDETIPGDLLEEYKEVFSRPEAIFAQVNCTCYRLSIS
jgi:hypothetical protein